MDGLINCTNLISLDLRHCDIQNVDGLAGCTKLTELNLEYCNVVKPKPSPGKMTTRKQVAAYQERIKKALQ